MNIFKFFTKKKLLIDMTVDECLDIVKAAAEKDYDRNITTKVYFGLNRNEVNTAIETIRNFGSYATGTNAVIKLFKNNGFEVEPFRGLDKLFVIFHKKNENISDIYEDIKETVHEEPIEEPIKEEEKPINKIINLIKEQFKPLDMFMIKFTNSFNNNWKELEESFNRDIPNYNGNIAKISKDISSIRSTLTDILDYITAPNKISKPSNSDIVITKDKPHCKKLTKEGFGKIIREARIAKGYTITKFADLINYGRTYISKLELGKEQFPKNEKLINDILTVLEIDPLSVEKYTKKIINRKYKYHTKN
jgi:Predicted transcriptional regulators